MKTALPRRLVAFAVSAGLVGSNCAFAQTAPTAIGVASSVVKDVKLSNARVPQPRPVVVRQQVALADLIQTGKGSQLQLLLLDRSTFSIGANASLRIDRFVYDPARGRSVGASVAKGAFRFMSGRPNRATGSTITTPVATIGIRGTILEGAVGEVAREIAKKEIKEVRDARADEQGATLVVLRGPGARTEGGAEVGAASVTSAGVTVQLSAPMQAAFVPRAGVPPIGPFQLSPEGLAKLQDRTFPQLAKGNSSGLILGGLLVAGAAAAGVLGSGNGDRPKDPGNQPQPSGQDPRKP